MTTNPFPGEKASGPIEAIVAQLLPLQLQIYWLNGSNSFVSYVSEY